MRRLPFSLFTLAVVFVVPCADAAPPTLSEQWSIDGFDAPESVAYDTKRNELLVTNVNGEGDAQDGNGYVSRVSPEGKMLQQRWVEGLDGPKGAAIRGRRLFIADIDDLVEIDLDSGKVIARHAVEGAKFLNDVVDAGDSGILVSDSANARIYRWLDGRMDVWLERPDLVSVNGLLRERERLVVSTMQGRLLMIDLRTRALVEVASGLGNADGIVALGHGDYLVSEWPGRLFHVRADSGHSVLIDSRAEEHYINDMLLVVPQGAAPTDKAKVLVVPSWKPGRLTAYRLGK